MGIKDIPSQFKIDSEEDLRAMVISYCSELGFNADEISCEDFFTIKLGHNAVNIDKKVAKGRSDILIARNGRPLVIIETKAPSHGLTDKDAQQAISYARLLSAIAPFAIVTNGRETKVYDVLADGLVEVDNPQDSLWNKNGQKISASAIADELKYEATKILIAINTETVEKFCQQQVASALSDLKSNVQKNKKYIPELYVERHLLNDEFAKWLSSGLSVFAAIAPSGYGKTNFMCAKVEEIVLSNFALFYSSGRFTKGLIDSIRNDFVWEFHRESDVVRILDRLDAIAQNAGKKIYIFIDAIDENPSGVKLIKNELLSFVSKLNQYPNIRLILSCKSFDWPGIVIDGNQSFNLLAENITPAYTSAERNAVSPNASKIGTHLDEFNSAELNEAIAKYRSAYSLTGNFHGELLQECRNPLMLRFVSEVYSEKKEELPTIISSLDLFDLYLNRKLEPLETPNIGEIILYKLALLIFDTNTRSLPKDQVILSVSWNEGFEKSLQDLFRLGVLSRTFADEQEKIGFEFNKFFLYIYIFKVKKLQSLPPVEQASHILELVKTPIGVEALDFYFPAVSQDVANATLVELTKQNFLFFVKIIAGLKGVDSFNKSPIPFRNIENYLQFYNHLRNTFFDKLKDSTMPYADMQLGVVLVKGRPEMFRGCTSSYPQNFVNIEDKELIKQLFSGPMNKMLYQDLMPVGAYHIGGIHKFSKYPQKEAFNHLVAEVSNSLSNRLLNESNAKDLLQERVYSILCDNPSFWLEGDDLPVRKRYWEILGYSSVEDLGNAKISDLTKQVTDLLNKFSSRLKTRDHLYPSYFHRTNDLFSVLFTLSQMKNDENLGHLKYSRDDLWNSHYKSFDAIADDLYSLIPIIIENYKVVFSENFSSLIDCSQFYKNIEKLVVVEAVKSSHSDFPSLSYIVAPHIDKTPSIKVVTAFQKSSLIERINFKSLYGGGYSMGGGDSGCGYFRLNANVGGVHLDDPEAWVVQTRYPSRTPILDQVYGLISHELKHILNASHMDWKDDISSRLVNDRYLQFAAKSMMNSGKK